MSTDDAKPSEVKPGDDKGGDGKPAGPFEVKISGCTQKTLHFDRQRVAVREISAKAGLPEDMPYKIGDRLVTSQTVIDLHDGMELHCDEFGGES